MKKTLLFTSILMIAGAMNAWAAACAETYSSDVLTIETVDGKCVATFDATSEETLVVPKNFTVDKVVLNRGFNAKTFGTMVLPISSDNIYFQNGQLNTISAMNCYEDNGKRTWQIDGQFVNSVKNPHIPFLIRSDNNGNPLEIIGNSPITVHATSSEDNLSSTFSDVWEFRGTYTYKKWETGDSQIGHVYGFAANNKGDNIKAGQFVRVAAGASVKPMRAYLYYNKKTANAGRPAANGVKGFAAIDDEDLPSTIEVVFQDKNGETTSIAQMNTVTGEFTSVTGWYDMKGRKLNKKPTQKGTYFNNGKKVVIK